jgi:methionyl-tRNA synthetase
LANQKEINIADKSKVQNSFKLTIDEMKNKVEGAFEAFELHEAVSIVNEMVSFGNRYFHENEPWKQGIEQTAITLNNVSYLIQIASELYEPIIPEGSRKAIEAIKKKEKVILYPKIK